jgi:hypothetical protein
MPTLPFLLLAPAGGGAREDEDGDDFVVDDMADRTLASHDSRAMGAEIDLVWKQVGELCTTRKKARPNHLAPYI